MKTVIWAALVLLLVILAPFATVWAFNVFGDTLWPGKQIPYTFDTWLAAIVIAGLFKTTISKKD
jgi:hypothetical protein